MAKRKSKKPNARNVPRAMPLAIAEPRLQGRREMSAELSGKKGHRHGAELSPAWIPLQMFLRQQAMAASALSNLLRFQHQAAQMWLSPSWR